MSSTAGALLVVHLFTSAAGTYNVDRIYEFSTMEDCLRSINTAQFNLSTGGEAESTGMLYCVPTYPFDQYEYSVGTYKKITIAPNK